MDIITGIILFLLAGASFFISVRSFMEKGFLFNNAYIYASKEQREKMNKKPYYRQSAIIFLLFGLVFLLNGFSAIFKADWIFFVVIAIIIIALGYTIVSEITRNKNEDNS